MHLTATATWIIFGGIALFIAIFMVLNSRKLCREKKLCLSILREAVRTHGIITTDEYAGIRGIGVKSARATLDKLFREGLVYGCTDEDLCWYWRITDEGRKRLDALVREPQSDSASVIRK